uniref:Uncharacterized protein n=1 Tax=Strombidium rassoulzadegani TaxID=1082188 RepID=A0A7S3CT37_9SPIT|mmetsp:Transcript_7131/g.12034  ORF Transcript_7131/g.12034 Transcript_7131/m.12034 type:complete len:115 (+) Transcript_7131:84-428(+)
MIVKVKTQMSSMDHFQESFKLEAVHRAAHSKRRQILMQQPKLKNLKVGKVMNTSGGAGEDVNQLYRYQYCVESQPSEYDGQIHRRSFPNRNYTYSDEYSDLTSTTGGFNKNNCC